MTQLNTIHIRQQVRQKVEKKKKKFRIQIESENLFVLGVCPVSVWATVFQLKEKGPRYVVVGRVGVTVGDCLTVHSK